MASLSSILADIDAVAPDHPALAQAVSLASRSDARVTIVGPDAAVQDDDAIRAVLAPLLAITRRDAVLRADRARLADVTAVPAVVLCKAGLDVERARRACRRRPRASVPPTPGRDAPSRPTKRQP
jgi:hypothetical protein